MNDQNAQHQAALAALDEWEAAVDALHALEAQIEAAKDRVNRAADELDKLIDPNDGEFNPNVRVKADATDAMEWRGKEGMLLGSAADYYEVIFENGQTVGIKSAELEMIHADDISF